MSYTIFELSEGYKSGKLNPESVIKDCLERVSSRDQWNTFITITDKLAYECLNNISDYKESDLYGIPIAFKDAIDIEGYVTSNGAVTEGVETSKKSAELVSKFIGKGAVAIGKNNLYDFSSGVTSINKIHGDVINPINKEVTAGGSSGGSAAAVAAGLVPCAVGVDTSGSVRIPAACCGVVGLKLAYNPGLHPGITPLSSTLDHIGFFTQDIRDMEIVYNSLFIKNSVESINYDKAIKIGIPNVYFNENFDEEINHMMDSVYKKFKNIHCEFVNVDTTFLENFDFIKASRGIGTPEFAFLHHENFTFHPELYSEGLKETFKRGRLISSFEYLTALKDKEQIKFEMNKIFNQVDIILTPTLPIVPPGIETELVINGNNQFDIGDIMIKYTSIFNLSGHPAVSIPSGYESNGISLGIQLIANTDDTPLLFKVGSLYESIRDK